MHRLFRLRICNFILIHRRCTTSRRVQTGGRNALLDRIIHMHALDIKRARVYAQLREIYSEFRIFRRATPASRVNALEHGVIEPATTENINYAE